MHFQSILVEDLIHKYQPEGLVLHGSRANNNAKKHSDWDIFVFLTQKTKHQVETYILSGEHIDACQVLLPLTLEDKWPNFVPQLAQGTIIYDPNNILSEVHSQIHDLFLKGPEPLSIEEVENRKRFWRRAIGRLEDNILNPIVFNMKFGIFYERMVRYFMEKHNKWDAPLYKSLPLVLDLDPQYYNLIEQLSSSRSPQEKVKLCKQAFSHIFEEAP